MPHVSQKTLKPQVFRKMSDGFMRITAALGKESNARSFLGELLTDTERVMLAKRLAAIVMLCRGYSGYKIRIALKLSASTVARLQGHMENDTFPYLERLFGKARRSKKRQATEEFWDALDKFLLMGMPPRVGRGRWKFLFKDR